MKLLSVLLLVVAAGNSWGTLPNFSWDTLPVFFHSSNSSGPYSSDALKVIAKYPMVTIEKWMGYDVKDVDDEDEMVMAMKAVKNINPNVATYFYMNSFKDRPEMTRMARELKENPDYALKDSNGTLVKNGQGYYVFDLSNPKVRQWWLDTCINATKYADGDGCYCDSSQHTDGNNFKPSITPDKQTAWGEGLLTLTKDVQDALGVDKLLIGKVAGQPHVKAVQIEFFSPKNTSITNLMMGLQNGQVMQAHVPVKVKCDGDLTDYIAAFLIGAEKGAYFGCGDWSTEGDDDAPFHWHPVYDKPLGAPLSSANYQNNTGIWTRQFSSGTNVTFSTSTNQGTILWGTGDNKREK
jgi:hypothetical protein